MVRETRDRLSRVVSFLLIDAPSYVNRDASPSGSMAARIPCTSAGKASRGDKATGGMGADGGAGRAVGGGGGGWDGALFVVSAMADRGKGAGVA